MAGYCHCKGCKLERRYQVLIRPGGKALVLSRSSGEAGQKVLMRDGRLLVTRMTLVDEIQNGHETVVGTLSVKPRQLGGELFNPMSLGRVGPAP